MNVVGRTTITPAEAIAVTLICFGISIVLSFEAMINGFRSAPFSDDGNY
jgi:hypothetical protein